MVHSAVHAGSCFPIMKAFVKLRKWSYSTVYKTAELGSFVDRLDSEIIRRGLSGSESEILAVRKLHSGWA